MKRLLELLAAALIVLLAGHAIAWDVYNYKQRRSYGSDYYGDRPTVWDFSSQSGAYGTVKKIPRDDYYQGRTYDYEVEIEYHGDRDGYGNYGYGYDY